MGEGLEYTQPESRMYEGGNTPLDTSTLADLTAEQEKQALKLKANAESQMLKASLAKHAKWGQDRRAEMIQHGATPEDAAATIAAMGLGVITDLL